MVAYNQFNKNAIIHESIYIILVLLGCANHIRNRKSRTISLAQKQRAENVCSKPYVGLMHGDVLSGGVSVKLPAIFLKEIPCFPV
jgi:hypothetical protein